MSDNGIIIILDGLTLPLSFHLSATIANSSAFTLLSHEKEVLNFTKIKNRKRDIRRFRTKSFVTFFRSFYDSHLPWGRVIICYKILPPPPLYPLKFKGLYFLSTTQQKKKSARISNENDLERFLVEQKPTGVPQLVSFGAASFALKGILPTSNFVQGK